MRPEPPRVSPLVVGLVVLVALGGCALAAAVMVPTMLGGVSAWVVAGSGCGLLIAALAILWVVQRRRDRSLW